MVTPSEVLVALSERTDESGYTSLSGLLAGDRAVTPIRLTGSVLHLDVALNLLGLRLGVIHRPSVLGDLPPSLDDVEWIEVTDEEFAEQAVNVLVLDPGTVMLDARHERLRIAPGIQGIAVFLGRARRDHQGGWWCSVHDPSAGARTRCGSRTKEPVMSSRRVIATGANFPEQVMRELEADQIKRSL